MCPSVASCTVRDFLPNCVCMRVCVQATEQFASDILREALAGAFAKSPQHRSVTPVVICFMLCFTLSMSRSYQSSTSNGYSFVFIFVTLMCRIYAIQIVSE